MPVPSFVVAGTQKAATTWLYECMNEHPEIAVPAIKELHYFCPTPACDKSRRGNSQEWYLAQLDDRPPYVATGEFSIDYMYYPNVAAELQALNPEMKILFILRDPVERAYSAYWMSRRSHASHQLFSSFIRPDSEYVARGFYHRQIERYRAVFPDSQILVLIYEDIAADPHAFVARAFDFVGADPSFRTASAGQLIAETKHINPMVSMLFYQHATRVLKFPPALWGWRQFKRLTGVKSRGQGSKPGSKYPPMSPEDRAALAALYRDENEKLFALLGRHIAQWEAGPGAG